MSSHHWLAEIGAIELPPSSAPLVHPHSPHCSLPRPATFQSGLQVGFHHLLGHWLFSRSTSAERTFHRVVRREWHKEELEEDRHHLLALAPEKVTAKPTIGKSISCHQLLGKLTATATATTRHGKQLTVVGTTKGSCTSGSKAGRVGFLGDFGNF